MSEKKLRLKIITPEKIKFDEDVRMAVMRGIAGDMGVLPGHEPCTAALDMGTLRIMDDGTELRIAVYGGLATVKNDALTVLTGDAEWPEEIDLAHAELSREHAERRLREKIDDMEVQNDQILLRRALVQIEVGSYSLATEESDED